MRNMWLAQMVNNVPFSIHFVEITLPLKARIHGYASTSTYQWMGTRQVGVDLLSQAPLVTLKAT